MAENNQERIQGRILKYAAQFWGLSEADLDVKAFDPVLDLFSGAFASEIALVNKELAASRARIEEGVLEHLTPDMSVNAIPAHAVAHARAVAPEDYARPSHQFFLTKDDEVKGTRDIYFSPVGKLPIVDGDVKYLVVGKAIFDVENTALRETVTNAQSGKFVEPGTVWVGLDLNSKLSSLASLSFFLTWRNQQSAEKYLPAIHAARWSIGDYELAIDNRLEIENTPRVIDEYSATAKVVIKVLNYYKPNFFSIRKFAGEKEREWSSFKEFYPKEFETIFDLEVLAKWSRPLIWIKIEIPKWVPQATLNGLVCYINSFPVINRRMHAKDYDVREHYGIVPMPTDFFFFDVEKVVNQDNYNYHRTALDNQITRHTGSYTLRRHAVGKFQKRDAKEHLEKLVNLMRDEADAFSTFDLTFLRGKLNSIKQDLTSLEQHLLEQHSQKSLTPYLFIKPHKSRDRISVEYWEINGVDANNLPSGSGLERYRSLSFQRTNINLVTTSRGGRDDLGKREKKYVYKNALLSRGRIVTIEDVRSYCRMIVQDNVTKIIVQKGFGISNHPKEGLIPVLEVLLQANEEKLPLLEEKKYDLEKELNTHSSILIPIKVKLVANGIV